MYSDTDEEDIEREIEEIRKLNAVLEEDDPCSSYASSQKTSTTAIHTTYTSKALQELSTMEEALSLNKIFEEKLRRLEEMLAKRLVECQQKLNEISDVCIIPEKNDSFHYFICGKPYFKDKSGFPPPDNPDTIFMRNLNMYDFSLVTTIPGWTAKDKGQFITEIHQMSQDLKNKELQSKLADFNRKKKINNCKNIDKQIRQLNKEISLVKSKPLSEVALPIDQDYDWELLSNKLNQRHTAHEYESLWKLYFHPAINKNSWTRAEHVSLQKFASELKYQGWDEIAKKLNTNRTSFQCFVYFRTNMSNAHNGRKWNNEETEYLRRIIDYYKEGNYIPWGKVAVAMESRTKIQIYNKYLRLYEDKKGRFVVEEDSVILNCVNKFGTNFRKMLPFLPGRSVIQIRNRYNVLSKRRISTTWTVKEDKQLIQLLANQDSNLLFSSLLDFFPGKNRENLRSRYITLRKWLKTHPDEDLKYAPRRAARRLVHGQQSDDLNQAIENLKNRMQSEATSKKNSKITMDSEESVIDDSIVTILYNEYIKEQDEREIQNIEEELVNEMSSYCYNINVANIRKILILLGSKLDKQIFARSIYSTKYPSLLDTKEDPLIKMKTYARKTSNVENIDIANMPDIWGNKSIARVQFVLPPNYANITGLRVLMGITNTKKLYDNEDNFSLCQSMKKNPLLKLEVELLIERFGILFLWPMLLSNEGPSPAIIERAKTKTVYKQKRIELNKTRDITIPYVHVSYRIKDTTRRKKDQKKDTTQPDQIDLDVVDDKCEVTIDENFIEKGLYEFSIEEVSGENK